MVVTFLVVWTSGMAIAIGAFAYPSHSLKALRWFFRGSINALRWLDRDSPFLVWYFVVAPIKYRLVAVLLSLVWCASVLMYGR